MTATSDGARTGKPTLEEVAAVAGVSRATVSRVINGSDRVSERARSAVEDAISALGYIPNRAARSLVTRRTDSIALVVGEPDSRLFGDPFFAAVARGVSQGLAGSGLQLVLLMQQDNGPLERYLTSGHVDGAILVSLHGQDPLPEVLRSEGLPVVVGGRTSPGSRLSYVDVDNVGGARQAVAYLLDQGKRRVATLAGPQDMVAGVDRLQGYEQALESRGLAVDPDLVHEGDFSKDSGERAMRAILDRCADVDAVFAASDLMAAGGLQALHQQGLTVPDSVAVVGFDDSIVAQSLHPPLTTVRQPVERMGEEMARSLLAQLEGVTDPQRLVLDTELVIRGSA